MTEKLNVLFFEASNPNFSPGKKVKLLKKIVEIPGCKQRYPLNIEGV